MDTITLRSIQHYIYCPHRWGLLEIDCDWAENYFVTKANLLHERVHNEDGNYTLRGKKVFTAVPVFNDHEPYGLYGVTDCIEGTEAKDGVHILRSERQYRLCIVEYKPTKPKTEEYHYDDLMQVFAQKICVDSVFQCDSEGVIYYADVKKRVPLPLRENYAKYDRELRNLLQEMRFYLEKGIIPPIRKSQKCSGCSMKNICMPNLKSVKGIRTQIFATGEIGL